MGSWAVSARAGGFQYQLAALLRARRAVSNQQRREGPASWWASRTLVAGLAALLVLGLLGFGTAAAGSERDPGRTAVIFLLAPWVATGYLTFGQLQAASQGHPLGPTRNLMPLSRRRSAALAMLERLLAPSALAVWMIGVAPWIGLWLGGGGWLSGAGWMSVVLLPLVPLAAREPLLGFQQYITAAVRGLIPAAGGLVMTVFFVTLPFWFGRIAGVVTLPRVDVLALPALEVANTWQGPRMAAGAVAVFTWIGVVIQAAPAPRSLRGLGRRWRWRVAMPSVAFGDARAELLMARMMLVQASRQPVYLYSAGLLGVIGVLAIVFPGAPGAGLLLVTGYLGPATSLFNLYGGDARHYQLWLATGRRLEEWTRARQLFGLAYLGLFGSASLVVMSMSGFLSGGETFAYSVALLDAGLLGLIFGPAASRFVLTPAITDVGTYASGARSSRTYVTWVSALACGGAGIVVSLALVAGGLWWLAFLPPIALAIVVAVAGMHRHRWTPALRERMARSLR